MEALAVFSIIIYIPPLRLFLLPISKGFPVTAGNWSHPTPPCYGPDGRLLLQFLVGLASWREFFLFSLQIFYNISPEIILSRTLSIMISRSHSRAPPSRFFFFARAFFSVLLLYLNHSTDTTHLLPLTLAHFRHFAIFFLGHNLCTLTHARISGASGRRRVSNQYVTRTRLQNTAVIVLNFIVWRLGSPFAPSRLTYSMPLTKRTEIVFVTGSVFCFSRSAAIICNAFFWQFCKSVMLSL